MKGNHSYKYLLSIWIFGGGVGVGKKSFQVLLSAIKNQHGFKKGRSITTLSVKFQSLIARALDEDNFVLVSSFVLSSVFGGVHVDLLLKRLKIISLPNYVVDLIVI
jgi:hypothetical protein